MGHRVSFCRTNNRQGQQLRVIATALTEREDTLLLVQLALGRFAGFWLLPSATPEDGPVEAAARRMLPERTGYPVGELSLASVVEEPKIGVLALRFVFRAVVAEPPRPVDDPDIVQARWFSRDAVREVLEERDVVPNLGVMSLLRAWAEGVALAPLELLPEDAQCPCGSGFGFRGCCGWDAK